MNQPDVPAPREVSALLEVRDLRARYSRVEVLHGIDLSVGAGEKVALLGPNGAGKTTLLRALSRTVRTSGQILLDGRDVTGRDAAALARLGVGHVPSGRGTFAQLSVRENLRLGQLANRGGSASEHAEDLDLVLATFPVLAQFSRRPAGQLSGGQQQMLALARALLGRPRLLLVDEPSLGLAPLVTRELFATLATVQRGWGMAVLLAEQNARLSLELTDRAYVLAGGRLAWSGESTSVTTAQLHAAYLGGHASSGQTSGVAP